MSDDENALIERCVSGDPAAWRELDVAYRPLVRRFLLRMGVPSDLLDDTCQDVFLAMFRFLPRFAGRASLKTWIYKICLSRGAITRRRRWLAVRLSSLFRAVPAPQVGSVEPDWSSEQLAARARAAVQSMRAAHREAFVLYELEGLSGEEVARILGCPVATIWRRLHYARAEFEKSIRGREETRSESDEGDREDACGARAAH